MSIVIGGDHAGYKLKKELLKRLAADGHELTHVGSYDLSAVDFPDIAKILCEEITSGRVDRGIMICGSGVGAAIACNKVKGIRASVIHDIYTAHQSVEHDDVQVMAIGAAIIGNEAAYELIRVFLQADFIRQSQFINRVQKLDAMND